MRIALSLVVLMAFALPTAAAHVTVCSFDLEGNCQADSIPGPLHGAAGCGFCTHSGEAALGVDLERMLP